MAFWEGQKDEKSQWNEEDGFYYDAISWGNPWIQQLPVRSLVGLIHLFATTTLEPELINELPSFRKRVEWFVQNRCDLAERNMASIRKRGKGNRILLSIVSRGRLEKIFKRMLDEDEFLSAHGIRSLSKYHKDHPYSMDVNGQVFKVGVNAGDNRLDFDEHWKDHLWFYEFFDGDTGRGLCASHQCGWTGLIARMIHDTGVNRHLPQTPRTPSVAMAHYFDDMVQRSIDMGTPRSLGLQRIRRSSTSRSVGARSDFDAPNGLDEDDARLTTRSTTHSALLEDPARARERAEADSHLHRYISDQLNRYKGFNGADRESEDEFKTKA